MATHPSEFQDLADELINDEFSEFRKTLTLTYGGTYNPATETTTGQTVVTYKAISSPVDFKEYQSLGFEISDKIAIYARTTDALPPIGAKAVLDGQPMRVIGVSADDASAEGDARKGAAVKLFLRAI